MAFYEGLGEKYRAAVESVSMDMWAPYISATLAMIPDAVMMRSTGSTWPSTSATRWTRCGGRSTGRSTGS